MHSAPADADTCAAGIPQRAELPLAPRPVADCRACSVDCPDGLLLLGLSVITTCMSRHRSASADADAGAAGVSGHAELPLAPRPVADSGACRQPRQPRRQARERCAAANVQSHACDVRPAQAADAGARRRAAAQTCALCSLDWLSFFCCSMLSTSLQSSAPAQACKGDHAVPSLLRPSNVSGSWRRAEQRIMCCVWSAFAAQAPHHDSSRWPACPGRRNPCLTMTTSAAGACRRAGVL